MGIISGQDSKLQIGAQSSWHGVVAPTKIVEFTSESLKLVRNYIEEDALVGRITTGRMDPAGDKVEGSFSMIVKPDNIGLLLSAALGAESAATVVGGKSTIYDHSFSCIVGGTSTSLPKLTIVVDRKATVKAFVGCKIDSMTLTAAINDYLRAEFQIRGRHEEAGTLASLNYSTKRAFQFVDGTITVDGSPVADVTDFKLSVKNNLENDVHTMDSSTYMQEIEPQKREITADLEVLYSSASDTAFRANAFSDGSTIALVCAFTSTESAGESEYYTLTLSIPLGYVTTADPAVGGPERIKMPVSVRASQDASNQPLTITLRDAQATKYIS